MKHEGMEKGDLVYVYRCYATWVYEEAGPLLCAKERTDRILVRIETDRIGPKKRYIANHLLSSCERSAERFFMEARRTSRFNIFMLSCSKGGVESVLVTKLTLGIYHNEF